MCYIFLVKYTQVKLKSSDPRISCSFSLNILKRTLQWLKAFRTNRANKQRFNDWFLFNHKRKLLQTSFTDRNFNIWKKNVQFSSSPSGELNQILKLRSAGPVITMFRYLNWVDWKIDNLVSLKCVFSFFSHTSLPRYAKMDLDLCLLG